MSDKKQKDFYRGYAIHDTNRAKITFDRNEYMDLIDKSRALHLTISDYLRLICQPCQTCGSNSILIHKIQSNIGRRTFKPRQKQLYIFINSFDAHKGMAETKLKLDSLLKGINEIHEDVPIFTPVSAHTYTEGECEATLIIFKESEIRNIASVLVRRNTIFIK